MKSSKNSDYWSLIAVYSRRKVIVKAPEYEGQAVRDRRILVILAGRPIDDASYDQAVVTLDEEIRAFRSGLIFGNRKTLPALNKGRGDNRRGGFETITWGISLGGGSKASSIASLLELGLHSVWQKPANLAHKPWNTPAIDKFEGSDALDRVTAWASSGFAALFIFEDV